MAIKVGGTTVVDDSRQLSNIASVDATTVAALGAAGIAGGGSARDFVATGTIANGNVVKLNSDGTVSITSGSSKFYSGSIVENYSNQWQYYDAVYHEGTNQIVIVFRNGDASNHPYYIIGSVNSDGTMTFNSPVAMQVLSVCYDVCATLGPNDSIVLGYNSSAGYYVVETYTIADGRNLTYKAVESTSGQSHKTTQNTQRHVYLSDIDAVLAVYTTQNYIQGTVFSINPTTYSITRQTTDYYWSASSIYDVFVTFDKSQNSTVFAWYDGSNGNSYVQAVKIASGTYSHSIGSRTLFNGSSGPSHSIEYHEAAQKSFVVYRRQSDSTTQMKTVTLSSGTSISLGSETQIDNTLGYAYLINTAYNPFTEEVIVSAEFPQTSSDGYAFTIGWNGSSPVISSPINWYSNVSSDTGEWPKIIALSGSEFAFIYSDVPAGAAIAIKYDSNFVGAGYGIANSSVTNGQSVEVISLGSIADNQTGLTIGTKYYYGDAGSLSTAGSVEAGIAVSTTELLITGVGV